MSNWSCFLLFCALALCSISTTAIEEHENHSVIVHVINALPNNSEPMQIRCTSKGDNLGVHTLSVGDDYKWSIKDEALYFCEAIWNRFMASWHAFQPRRDLSHGTVFWMVKKDGFFLSWDKSSWVKKSTWETE